MSKTPTHETGTQIDKPERRGVRRRVTQAAQAAGNILSRVLFGPEQLTPEKASVRKATEEYGRPLPEGSATARADAVLQRLVSQSGGGGPELTRTVDYGRTWLGVGQDRSVVFGDVSDPQREAARLVRKTSESHTNGVIPRPEGEYPVVLTSPERPESPFARDTAISGVYLSRSAVDDPQKGQGTRDRIHVAVHSQSKGTEGYERRDHFIIDGGSSEPSLYSEIRVNRMRPFEVGIRQPDQAEVNQRFGQVMGVLEAAETAPYQPAPEPASAR